MRYLKKVLKIFKQNFGDLKKNNIHEFFMIFKIYKKK